MKTKKAISPLIATVLILGFTVALAAIIMTWGTGFTKNIQKSTEETSNNQLKCALDVDFEIVNACVSESTIKITLKNNKEKEIVKSKVVVYTSESSAETLAYDAITALAFGTNSITVTPTLAVAQIKKVEVIPTIKVESKEVVCSSNIATFGEIGDITLETCAA